MTENLDNKKEKKKEFFYKGIRYFIEFSKKVDSVGDFFELGRIIYIDEKVPEKFHEGIAIHEIIERDFLKQGHSYGWSHNKAQQKELEFYKKKFGNETGEKLMNEEEKFINELFLQYVLEDMKLLESGDNPFGKVNIGFREPIPKNNSINLLKENKIFN